MQTFVSILSIMCTAVRDEPHCMGRLLPTNGVQHCTYSLLYDQYPAGGQFPPLPPESMGLMTGIPSKHGAVSVVIFNLITGGMLEHCGQVVAS